MRSVLHSICGFIRSTISAARYVHAHICLLRSRQICVRFGSIYGCTPLRSWWIQRHAIPAVWCIYLRWLRENCRTAPRLRSIHSRMTLRNYRIYWCVASNCGIHIRTARCAGRIHRCVVPSAGYILIHIHISIVRRTVMVRLRYISCTWCRLRHCRSSRWIDRRSMLRMLLRSGRHICLHRSL